MSRTCHLPTDMQRGKPCSRSSVAAWTVFLLLLASGVTLLIVVQPMSMSAGVTSGHHDDAHLKLTRSRRDTRNAPPVNMPHSNTHNDDNLPLHPPQLAAAAPDGSIAGLSVLQYPPLSLRRHTRSRRVVASALPVDAGLTDGPCVSVCVIVVLMAVLSCMCMGIQLKLK